MKKKQINLILVGLSALFAVLGVVLFLFLDVVQFKVGDLTNEEAVYSGLEVVFGYKETMGEGMLSVSVEFLKFSFLALIPLILAVAGLVLSLIGIKVKLFSLISGALYVLAAILLIFTPNFVVLTDEAKELLNMINESSIEAGFVATTMTYVTTALLGVAGLSTASSALFK